jgi:hypothetical protein
MGKFEDLNNKELLAVAEMFGTDLVGSPTKAAIIKQLGIDGVTYDMYVKATATNDEDDESPVELAVLDDTPLDETGIEVEPAAEEDYHVVCMTRTNATYEIRGYKFTRQHPYALVKEVDADYLIEEDGGFRLAGPREIREYYAKA